MRLRGGRAQGSVSTNEDDSRGHRWHLFHLAGLCFAAAMRVVPRRRRFGAALLVARAAVPLIRRTQAYREQSMSKVDGACEVALHLVLHTLTKNGTEFDPVIDVRGYEEVVRAFAVGKGVLVIGPHAALNLLLVRRFHDDGFEPIVVSADPLMRVGGTTLTAQTVQPSQTFLVKTRSRLRGGKLVCAMPDRAEHHEGRTVEFGTANGRVIIAPALMRVAARCQARVVFTEVHVEGRGLVGTIAAPSREAGGSAEAITRDFVEFVRAHVEARRASCA